MEVSSSLGTPTENTHSFLAEIAHVIGIVHGGEV